MLVASTEDVSVNNVIEPRQPHWINSRARKGYGNLDRTPLRLFAQDPSISCSIITIVGIGAPINI